VQAPVAPSPAVWDGIERRLFPDAASARGAMDQATQGLVRWWQKLVLWQGATAMATVAAVSLGLLLSQPGPVQPPIVVVMAAQPDAAKPGVQPVGFVASVGGDGRSLVLKPLNEGQQVALNKALELWAVPAQGAPRSLGLVSAQGATTVMRAQLLKETAAFAVSVEPPGGSPTGAPTGPIISVGKLQI
uniref:anti-sigma factor n=1 Tax=Aquabacterium sp. TaxID=1872578 RepID=UPI0025BF359F